MKRDWIKLDVDILNDPAYGTLTDDLWRLMIQLNLLAGEVDKEGLLPGVRDMAWELRVGLGTLQISLHHLCERGLVHSTPQGWVVSSFKESQAAPNSTERSRAFRKRRKSATQEGDESSESGTQGASEMQPSRHLPVSKPVPTPDPDPGLSKQSSKGRHRHKPKLRPVDTCPVEKPVDNPVEKGRKNSDSSAPSTSSTSSLIKYLKPSLNLKLPLLELLDQPDLEVESENFRPSQVNTPETRLDAPGNKPFAAAQQVPPGWIEGAADQSGVASEFLRGSVDKAVDTYPVDNYPVDKPVEKGRNFSDPDDIPP